MDQNVPDMGTILTFVEKGKFNILIVTTMQMLRLSKTIIGYSANHQTRLRIRLLWKHLYD